ncbi:O-antigen ligase family protein [Halobacillus salinarum]|uniref:O-antigen ligase family protein n=1 Tax=Halobacillus salinarum TaxID=2932257 RepID=A0ABY4ETG4_9BACI|nr:O-antigen ligase family protein [Halobacillus salinarum]UOQ45416.1 O-antigen ligase family protein [Halobacillus salinarum]
MDYKTTEATNNRYLAIFCLFLLVILAKYNIYMGFALKPFMIFTILYLVINLNAFYFHRLQLFEIIMLLFYLVYCFTGAFALYPVSSIRIMLGIFLYLGCYFIMKAIIGETKESLIEKALSSVGILFNSASLLLYFLGLHRVHFIFEGDRISKFGMMLDRNYPRLIGLMQDPNFYVFYNTVFFAYFLCNSKSIKNKVGLILCILTNLLTFSRGGMLVMLLLLFLYILLNNPLKKIRLISGLFLSVFLVAYIAIVKFNFNFIGIMMERIADTTDDGGSGRLALWGRAWHYFENHMYVGVGAFNFSDYNLHDYGDTLTVHNTFLDILSDSGLVGIFFFLLFIGCVLYQLLQNRMHKHHPYLFLTFIGLILQMGFLSVVINDMFFLYIAILSAYINKQAPLSLKDNRSARMPLSLSSSLK